MRLVADPLQEEERLRSPGDRHRVGAAGDEHLFEGLGQGGHRDLVAQAQSLEHPHPHPQLSLAPVEEDELRRVGEAFASRGPVGVAGAFVEEGGEAPGQDLLHGRVVVVAGDVADTEAAVVRQSGEAVLEDDHGTHVGGALDVAHVVTLDAQRSIGELRAPPGELRGPGRGCRSPRRVAAGGARAPRRRCGPPSP